jgi:hypothetical protein
VSSIATASLLSIYRVCKRVENIGFAPSGHDHRTVGVRYDDVAWFSSDSANLDRIIDRPYPPGALEDFYLPSVALVVEAARQTAQA